LSDQLVFNNTIEALLRSVRDRLTPRMKEQLRALGLDVDRKLDPGYPADRWASFVKFIAAQLYPGVGEPEALRQIGARTVDAYAEGLVGSALFTVLRLAGPDRTIGRMTKNFRTGSNYVETKSTQLGPHRYEIWFNDVSGVPGFYIGMLESGMRHSGARDPVATVSKTEGAQCSFVIEWK
jgi:uncharacterized protein (TIGR02265 family)